MIRKPAMWVSVHGQTDLGDDRAQQLLALDAGGAGCGEDCAHVRAGAAEPGKLGVGERYRAAGLLGGQVVLGPPLRGEFVLERFLQGPGDQTVLRLDGVELAQRAVGFEPVAFHRELEHAQPPTVLGLGLGECLRGGGQRGRLEHREQLVEHGVLQPASADALAARLTGIQLLSAGAQITRTVPFRPGIADLHDPTAAQQPLQQRRAFPRCATAVTAWGSPVRPQPRGVRLIGRPVDEPGMVIGDQHFPLLAGQQPHPAGDPPAGRVDAFLGAGPAEHERPA